MLCKAYSNLSDLTDAKPGDKTLIDVLSPAIEAYESNKSDFKQALKAMTEVAEKGLESTKTMVAKIGRASRLGERSRGHQDAGATSCYLILKAIADASLRLLEEGE
jgi:dihydroxyacetone kinase-like protein